MEKEPIQSKSIRPERTKPEHISERINVQKPPFLKYWLYKLTPPCNDITVLASKAMDMHLSLKEEVQLRVHLLVCHSCKRFSVQLRLIREHFRFAFKEDTFALSSVSREESNTSPFTEHLREQTQLSDEARTRIQQIMETALQK